jgi:hypothetical protein
MARTGEVSMFFSFTTLLFTLRGLTKTVVCYVEYIVGEFQGFRPVQ